MGYLAVQRIQIVYDDDHRGRVHAEQRARIRAFPIAPIAGDGVYHDCRCDAWSGYEPTTTTRGLPRRDGELVVEVHPQLQLRPADDRLIFEGGASAEWRAKAILEVPRGGWGRVVLNTKVADHDHKYLHEIVVNAGLFTEPPAGQVFLGEPTVARDVRGDFLRNGTLGAR